MWPLTARYWAAKRQGRIVALPLLAILLDGSALSIWRLLQRTQGHLAFASAFAHAYVLLVLCNLVHLLVRLRPWFAVLPGTAGMAAYDDVGFHVAGFGTFGPAPSAAIAPSPAGAA